MTLPARTRAQPYRATLEHLFGIDIRSLALFRIGLGSVLLACLVWRIPDVEAYYTDFGILPRSAFTETFGPIMGRPSLHLMTGSVAGAAALLVLASAFAVALIVGYRTRLAVAASWVLLVSLENRNPLVIDGGDIVLRMLLFWSLFLPLGACYSVDRALDPTPPERLPTRVLSVGSAALLLQVGMVYWFAAVLKNDPSWRTEGTAVYYALSIPQFVTPLGMFLREFPLLLKAMTFATVVVEGIGPFLAFLPGRAGPLIRTLTVFGFIGFHFALGACLTLGLFPWISAVGWVAFLPTWFWEKCRSRFVTGADSVRLYYNADSPACRKTVGLVRTFLCLPEAVVLTAAQADPAITAEMAKQNSWLVLTGDGKRHFRFAALAPLCRTLSLLRPLGFFLDKRPVVTWGDALYRAAAAHPERANAALGFLEFRPVRVRPWWPAQAVAALFLVYVILWNLRTIDFARYRSVLPVSANWAADLIRLDQSWDMFAPYPLKAGGWYVIPGTLKDGTEVDLFRNGEPVTWQRPTLVSTTFASDRWRKYMVNLLTADFVPHLNQYGGYLCRKWNREHTGDKQVETLSIYYMEELTLPDYQPPRRQKRLLWRHYCFHMPANTTSAKTE